MSPLHKPYTSGHRLTLVLALSMLLASSQHARADDPFAMEPSSWIAFDRYKEKPKSWIPPEIRAQAALEPVIIAPPTLPPDMPIFREPQHPIDTPVLPGLNRGFGINVTSITNDHEPLDLNAKAPDLAVSDTRWKSAVQFAKNKKPTDEELTSASPLDVRYTLLPRMRLEVPKPKPKIVDSLAKKPDMVAAVKPPAPIPVASPPTVDVAACAAVDAYKKRQLAALESDRATLAALQSVIAKMGLQKKLDFMGGAAQNLKVDGIGISTIADQSIKN